MKNFVFKIVFIAIFLGGLTSCAPKRYVVTGVEGSKVLMDSAWDKKVDPSVQLLIAGYKSQLEAQMNQKIGEAAQTMTAGYPQSLLTNLTADAIKQFGEQYTGGTVDFAVMNVGGLRSALNKGTITIGNMYEIYSFDNLAVILDIDAKAVKELFGFYAFSGGQGLSSNVELVVKNRAIVSLKIGGAPVDDNRMYRVATIDYLAEGNNGMVALTQAKKTIATGVTLRDMMIEFVKKQTAAGQKIDSCLDNRIVIEK
jgi:2',3'-cyclic-nucleotide 2'-phosphodiesterase (5'-nucleotidase family)